MTRAILPARRYGESFGFEWDAYPYRVQVSTIDGTPLEVFVNARKVDSGLDAIAGDIAILMSLLLQHGMTAGDIGHALRRNPNGTRVTIAGALADCIAAHRFKVRVPYRRDGGAVAPSARQGEP